MKHPGIYFPLKCSNKGSHSDVIWQIVPHLWSVHTEGSVGKFLVLSSSSLCLCNPQVGLYMEQTYTQDVKHKIKQECE